METVDKTKYLGAILDSHLTYSNHGNYIRGKAMGRIKMSGRTRNVVSTEISLQLYKTFVSPIFDYAAPAYDCLLQRVSYSVQKVHNCTLRIILRADRRSHMKDMHVQMHVDK